MVGCANSYPQLSRYNMTTGKYKDAATSFSQVKPQDPAENRLGIASQPENWDRRSMITAAGTGCLI